MSAHTPGPWYVDDSGQADEHQEPILHISPEDGYGVRPIFRAKVTMLPVRKTKMGGPKHKELAAECEATARLIAAAPDLLEALQSCFSELKALNKGIGWRDGEWHHVSVARAAIAKATGEQP